MARHESDMHRRLRQALYTIQAQQSEIDALREALWKAEQAERAWAEIARNLFVNQDLGQFEIGAALRDRREGKS